MWLVSAVSRSHLCMMLATSSHRVRVVRAVGPDRGGKVTLELNIGSARSGWVVFAGEASGQVLEDLLIVQVWDRA